MTVENKEAMNFIDVLKKKRPKVNYSPLEWQACKAQDCGGTNWTGIR